MGLPVCNAVLEFYDFVDFSPMLIPPCSLPNSFDFLKTNGGDCGNPNPDLGIDAGTDEDMRRWNAGSTDV